MPSYKAPVTDMRFVLKQVWNLEQHLTRYSAFSEFNIELIDAILDEAAKINENLIAPLNQIGDEQGCTWKDKEVITPEGFKEAYQTFQQAGWPALSGDPQYGGQGVPHMVSVLVDEMLSSANVSFHLYPNLTTGVARAIQAHASEALKDIYLPRLVSGEWTGAMCLTESHCGTDLGLIRTKAVKQTSGSYKLTGTKIFITSGEHDLVDNIIHLVLARTEGAPEGIKGLSLFIVPKVLLNEDESLGARNNFHCGSIEHKMGIKGSCTCVINYEGAEGYLVGEELRGINGMFTVMNVERLCIGMQGLGLAEVSYQNALIYAKDRLQGRAAHGILNKDKEADPIIVHPDVRRMLLWMKSHNEAARAMAIWIAMQVDIVAHGDTGEKAKAGAFIDLFTPVIKAFFTDYGFEACNLGMQLLGGHGYVSEWGLEQFVRDARIAQLYEGTNGIQALDLVRRKLVANNGEYLNLFIEEVQSFIESAAALPEEFTAPLKESLNHLQSVGQWIITESKADPALMGSASVDYLQLLGMVGFAYMWARMVAVADEAHADKIDTGRFFYQKVLPQVASLVATIKAGSDSLMQPTIESFYKEIIMEASDGGGDEQSGLKESTSFINLSAAVDGHVDWQGERVTGDSDEEEGEDKKSTEHEKNASHADPLAEERPLAPPTTPITNRKLAEALDGMVTDSYRVTTLLSTCCSTMFSYAKLTVNKALYCCPPFADDSSSVKSMKQS